MDTVLATPTNIDSRFAHTYFVEAFRHPLSGAVYFNVRCWDAILCQPDTPLATTLDWPTCWSFLTARGVRNPEPAMRAAITREVAS